MESAFVKFEQRRYATCSLAATSLIASRQSTALCLAASSLAHACSSEDSTSTPSLSYTACSFSGRLPADSSKT